VEWVFNTYFCIPGWFFIGAIFLSSYCCRFMIITKKLSCILEGWSRLIIRGAIDADYYCQECCLCANDVSIVPHRVVFCPAGKSNW